jgi:hypothetical protein
MSFRRSSAIRRSREFRASAPGPQRAVPPADWRASQGKRLPQPAKTK